MAWCQNISALPDNTPDQFKLRSTADGDKKGDRRIVEVIKGFLFF